MKLIVGLGNPGAKYKYTRHNIGFLILDKLAGKNKWQVDKKSTSEVCLIDDHMMLCKPQTFMNNSGQAVMAVMNKYHLSLADIIIIHDDKDLVFGKIKVSTESGSAGHNGVQSIIDQLKSKKFSRLRLGVASDLLEKMPTDQFVLKTFTAAEKKQLSEFINRAIGELEKTIY